MTPPDFSVMAAFNTAVYLLSLTLPSIAIIVGIVLGTAVLMWVLMAARDALQDVF